MGNIVPRGIEKEWNSAFDSEKCSRHRRRPWDVRKRPSGRSCGRRVEDDRGRDEGAGGGRTIDECRENRGFRSVEGGRKWRRGPLLLSQSVHRRLNDRGKGLCRQFGGLHE